MPMHEPTGPPDPRTLPLVRPARAAGAASGPRGRSDLRSVAASAARWVADHPRETAAIGLGVAAVGLAGPVRVARGAVAVARFAAAAAPVAVSVVEAVQGRPERSASPEASEIDATVERI